MTALVLVAQIVVNPPPSGGSWVEFMYARYVGREMTHAAVLNADKGVPQTLSREDVEWLRTQPEEFFA